ncbi:MAG: hypothetical protein V4730_04350 [Pseudomonadota bacterium]
MTDALQKFNKNCFKTDTFAMNGWFLGVSGAVGVDFENLTSRDVNHLKLSPIGHIYDAKMSSKMLIIRSTQKQVSLVSASGTAASVDTTCSMIEVKP